VRKQLVRRLQALPARSKLRLAWRLLRDQRMPVLVKAVIPALVAYLLMPLDIIPDFIPVLGQLDDLLLIVLAVAVIFRFTPVELLEEHIRRLEAEAPAGMLLALHGVQPEVGEQAEAVGAVLAAHAHGHLAQVAHVPPELRLRQVALGHRQEHHRHPVQAVAEDHHLVVLIEHLRLGAAGDDGAEDTGTDAQVSHCQRPF
jgi:uncharacterized membrane protein YkvA (DUF1232 family)